MRDSGEPVTRICITGGPRTGKTVLANKLADELGDHVGTTVAHTDDLIEELKHLGKEAWSEASRRASEWLDAPGPWFIEGVAVSRALRKWRDAHPGEPPPVDRVIYLRVPCETLTGGQTSMAKGVRTVHDEIEPWLLEHGIRTELR